MRSRILKFASLLVVAVLLFGLVGCGKSPTDSGTKDPKQGKTEQTENKSITLVGSDSMQNVTFELAELFQAENEGVSIEVNGGGSGASFEPVRGEIAQLGLVSRELKGEENDITATVIGRDGIAVVVNKNNSVKDLTLEQIAKIYAGEITNWKEVGGKDQKITVIAREAGSGTTGAFEDIVMKTIKQEIAPSVLRINQSEGIRATVAKDESAIGYFSLYIADETVHALSVEGVEANADNVKSGDYKLQRPFNFTYLGLEPKDETAKKFLEFILSDKGQKIVTEHGLITK